MPDVSQGDTDNFKSGRRKGGKTSAVRPRDTYKVSLSPRITQYPDHIHHQCHVPARRTKRSPSRIGCGWQARQGTQAPMSEMPFFGRNAIYIGTLLVFFLLQLAVIYAKNFGMLLASDFSQVSSAVLPLQWVSPQLQTCTPPINKSTASQSGGIAAPPQPNLRLAKDATVRCGHDAVGSRAELAG